jgi:polygalacturonase
VNLGQGFPDDPGPADVRAKAAEAVMEGWNSNTVVGRSAKMGFMRGTKGFEGKGASLPRRRAGRKAEEDEAARRQAGGASETDSP